MKTLKLVFLPALLILLVVGCGSPEPTFQEKLESGIESHFLNDSISDIYLSDTVNVDVVNKALGDLNELKVANDLALIETPVRIDSAVLHKQEGEASLETVMDMLKPFVEENITKWGEIIEKENRNFVEQKAFKVENESQILFYTNALGDKKNDVVYYIVNVSINAETKRLAINPNFEVIKEF